MYSVPQRKRPRSYWNWPTSDLPRASLFESESYFLLGPVGTLPLLIACRQGPTVSVNLQVPVGTKASGLQQLLAAANGVDVSNDVTIKAAAVFLPTCP